MGGQPSNFLDDCPIKGTGEYYYDPRYVGLVCMEDLLVQIDELGIKHGYDVNRVLLLGRKMEKTIGARLRSEAIINGRTIKEGHMEHARPGLKKLIEKEGEKPGQQIPVRTGRLKSFCLTSGVLQILFGKSEFVLNKAVP